MTNPPQNLTDRYVSALLYNGRNNRFDLLKLEQQASIVGQETVGYYYNAVVENLGVTKEANGPTPMCAVKRALEKHGVNFK